MAGGIDWFRWHHGSVVDQKFGLIGRKARASVAEVIAVWACLLENASAAEDRGAIGEVDFEAMDFGLGMDEGKAMRIYTAMVERKLIDDAGMVTRWHQRQPKRERVDESSTERSRAHRAKQRQETPESDDATPCNATQRQETPRGEESREEKRKESNGETEVVAAASASPSPAEPPLPPSAASPETPSPAQRAPRATRLPADFAVPDDWRQWTAEQFPAWPREAVDLEASKFADHWHAVPGKDGLKLDWAGTWRNWCRRARPVPQARGSPGRRTWTEQQSETIAGLTGASKRPEVIDVVATRVG